MHLQQRSCSPVEDRRRAQFVHFVSDPRCTEYIELQPPRSPHDPTTPFNGFGSDLPAKPGTHLTPRSHGATTA